MYLSDCASASKFDTHMSSVNCLLSTKCEDVNDI